MTIEMLLQSKEVISDSMEEGETRKEGTMECAVIEMVSISCVVVGQVYKYRELFYSPSTWAF
jgi:hypothetical protein